MKSSVRAMLNRFPRLKATLKHLLGWLRPSGGVSSNYVQLKDGETEVEASRLRAAWQDSELPHGSASWWMASSPPIDAVSLSMCSTS